MAPSVNQYQSALLLFPTPPYLSLRYSNLRLAFDEKGPVMRVAKNAVVFKLTNGKVDKAIKCYIKHIDNQFTYLSEVQQFLSRKKNTPFIPFEILPDELTVLVNRDESVPYSVVYMPWIEGTCLMDQITSYCLDYDVNAIEKLSKSFEKLALQLLQYNFSHGNLSPAGIIVTADGEMVLVDHDNICFSALADINGIADFDTAYQHPVRNNTIPDLHADHFPILLISICLKALTLRPELFQEFNPDNGLLFSESDLCNLAQSGIYKELETIDDLHLNNLLILLWVSANGKKTEIPGLAEYLAGDDLENHNKAVKMQMDGLKKELVEYNNRVAALQLEITEELIFNDKVKAENKRLKKELEVFQMHLKKTKQKKRINTAVISVFFLVLVSSLFLKLSNISPGHNVESNQAAVASTEITQPKQNTKINTTQKNMDIAEKQATASVKTKIPKLINKIPEAKKTRLNLDRKVADRNAVAASKSYTADSKKYGTSLSKKYSSDDVTFRSTGF